MGGTVDSTDEHRGRWALGRRARRLAFLAILTFWTPLGSLAEEKPTLSPSGLPLPRFVSLDADRVNLRTGPGVRYPIAWVFVRRDMPVEVIAEFELWRKIRDIDGAEGWAHRSMLSGRRSAIVMGEVRALHGEPDERAPPVLYAEPMVQGRLLACRADWCEMRIAGRRGWLPRGYIWGAYPWERFD